jgi:hypothetical protein
MANIDAGGDLLELNYYPETRRFAAFITIRQTEKLTSALRFSTGRGGNLLDPLDTKIFPDGEFIPSLVEQLRDVADYLENAHEEAMREADEEAARERADYVGDVMHAYVTR